MRVTAPWTLVATTPPAIVLATMCPFTKGQRQPALWAESQHIVVCLSGQGRVWLGEREYLLSADHAVVVPWGQAWVIEADVQVPLTFARGEC